nr:MAG TPA: hypothetical protein [Caudoviricetes sp.]
MEICRRIRIFYISERYIFPFLCFIYCRLH